MATIYNLLRSAILDRWDGQQPVSEVSLGIRTYSAWWMLGADMQPAQHEASQSETGRALINLVCGCSVKRDIPREDRLAVMDADQVPALFRARAVEYLGTDDVVVLHDVSAARYQKVVACAVPGEWWRAITTEPSSTVSGDSSSDQHDDDEQSNNRNIEHSSNRPAEPSSPATDGQLSLDFDQMQAPDHSSLLTPHSSLEPNDSVATKLAPLAERYLLFFGSTTTLSPSAWDGKMHRSHTPGAWAWVLMAGTIACLLMVLALQQLVFTTYDVMHYSLLPLWLMPLVALASAYVWNYRRKAGNQLRSAMASLKNHQSCASSAIRSLIDEYSGSQRSDLMEVYYQVFN